MKALGFTIIFAIATPALSWIVFSDKELNESSNNSDITLLPLRYVPLEYFLYLDFEEEQKSILYNVQEGDNVTIYCNYRPPDKAAALATKYTFFFHPEGEPDDKLLQEGERNITTLRKVRKLLNEGHYKCEAQGPSGTIKSYIIYLSIQRNETAALIEYENLIEALLHLELDEKQFTLRDIVEEGNVTFWCEVRTPTPSNDTDFTAFFHNGTRMISDEKEGITIDGRYLKMVRINKTTAGNYTCETYDRVRRLTSDPWNLVVYDKPVVKATTDAPDCHTVPSNFKVRLYKKSLYEVIDEFSTVEFVCEVTPNTTEILRLMWSIDTRELFLNPDHGVHFIDSTLKLVMIPKYYTGTSVGCWVETEQGLFCSNEIGLAVMRTNGTSEAAWWLEQRQKQKPVLPTLRVKLEGKKSIHHINEFDDLNLTCVPEVLSNRTVIYRFSWFFKGRILLPNAKLGITFYNSTLSLKSIAKTSSGEYICQAHTNRDYLYSEPLWLTVRDITDIACDPNYDNLDFETVPPTVTLQLVGKNLTDIQQFDTVILFCNVEPNTTEVSQFRWFLESRRLSENVDAGIFFYRSNSILELPRIEMYSEGTYICQAHTEHHVTYSNSLPIHIREKFYNSKKVRVTAHLGDGIKADQIRESDDVYLFCVLRPKIINIRQLVWLHQDNRLYQDSNPFVRHGNSTLIFLKIQKTRAGNYSCRVDTDDGVLFSNSLEIKVKDRSSTTRDETPFTKSTSNTTLDIRLVNGLIMNRIRESDDVYITCSIKPEATSVNRSFYWTYDLTPLSNIKKRKFVLLQRQKSSTLIILRVNKHQRGGYQCVIKTADGRRLESESLLLEVRDPTTNVPPSVQIQLGDRWKSDRIRKFDCIFFICNINPHGMNVREIMWFHNDVALQSYGEVEIVGLENLLVIQSVEERHVGKYLCQVETDIGNIVRANPVTISVVDAKEDEIDEELIRNPVVIATSAEHPAWIYHNARVDIRCYVFPITIKFNISGWYYDGNKMLKNPVPNYDAIEYPGADNPSLHSEQFTEEPINYVDIQYAPNETLLSIYGYPKQYAGGNITCEVETTAGRFHSFPAHIAHVNDEPPGLISRKDPDRVHVIAELQNDPAHIHKDDIVYFYCVLQPPTDFIQLQWFYKETFGEEKLIKEEYEIHISADKRTLTIDRVKKMHLGGYVCQVETYDGIFKSKPTLLSKIKQGVEDERDIYRRGIVDIAVEVVSQSEIDNILVNEDTMLFCNIKPNDWTTVFEIHWRLNGLVIIPHGSNDMILYDGRVLILRKIQKTSIGNYTCHAESKKGDLNSYPVYLFVKDYVKLKAELQDCPNVFYKNDFVYFFCDVQPSTIPFTQPTWYRGSQKLQAIHDEISFSYQTMILHKVEKKSEGNYSCRIETQQGYYKSRYTELSGIKEDKIHLTPESRGQPFLTTHLRENLKQDEIYEQMNLSLYCHIKPDSTAILRIYWYNKRLQLAPDGVNGVTYGFRDQFLHLRNITSKSSGSYFCRAITKKGYVSSRDNAVKILVQCKP